MLHLDLSGLSLTTLPMWSLESPLLTLDLHGNGFTDLPKEVELLSTSLELLDLRANPLRQVPKVIGKLKRLQDLYLCETEIRTLPHWLTHLPDLKLVQCYGLDVSADEALRERLWPRPVHGSGD